MSYDQIDRNLQAAIREVENDDSLTPVQKAKEIALLEKEAREFLRGEE